ncbi:MAG: DsbE family thiol:disulfide interchange protein [Sedimenticola sp.]|jgi:cytochrome c biogenesis protein CcmG/thiol:disulfide interchange protein DsbE|nr:MAG: DsbE family thiol:disulfide interchange protein [Sedimenticola sp.]
MKARYLVPLGIFIVLVVFLGIGLTLNPRDVPSVLINKKAPEFSLPDLFDENRVVSSESMKGKVWLLNVWGTWCPECWREHGFLMYLKGEGVPIVGIDWRDESAEAKKMLAQEGNPFLAVGVDPESKAIMDWGVYGAPETFLIDKEGFIRWKYAGGLNAELWRTELKPLMDQLEGS